MAQQLPNFPEGDGFLSIANASTVFASNISAWILRLINETFGSAAIVDAAPDNDGGFASIEASVLVRKRNLGGASAYNVGQADGELPTNSRVASLIAENTDPAQQTNAFGTAALLNAGSGAGQVPVLSSVGRLPASVLPTSVGAPSIVRRTVTAVISGGGEQTVTTPLWQTSPVSAWIEKITSTGPRIGGDTAYFEVLPIWSPGDTSMSIYINTSGERDSYTITVAGLFI